MEQYNTEYASIMAFANQNGMVGSDMIEDILKAAWINYLRNINGFEAIVDGIEQGFQTGNWEGVIDGIKSMSIKTLDSIRESFSDVAKSGGFGQIAQVASSGDPVAAMASMMLNYMTQQEEVQQMFEPLMNDIDRLAESLLPAFISILQPIISVLEASEPLLHLLFYIVKGVSVVLVGFENGISEAILNIRWAIGMLTFWTDEDNVSREEINNITQANAERLQAVMDMEYQTRDDFNKSLAELDSAYENIERLYSTGQITGAQMVAIASDISGTTPDYAAANGADFFTTGQKTIRVGENGREHVRITPAPIHNTGFGDGQITINVNGSQSPELTAMAVKRELDKARRRGLVA